MDKYPGISNELLEEWGYISKFPTYELTFFQHPITKEWCVGDQEKYFSTGIKDRIEARKFMHNLGREYLYEKYPSGVPKPEAKKKFSEKIAEYIGFLIGGLIIVAIASYLVSGFISDMSHIANAIIHSDSTPPVEGKEADCREYVSQHYTTNRDAALKYCMSDPEDENVPSTSGSPGYHYVQPYTKSNGTHVDGYIRSNPDGDKSNNINHK
ncbi:hypothetical protein ACFPOG_12940 [Paenibacillus aestuarii]|uniref:Uncharacterized protein n=1 Tax=Paenibacillus aestuarii TaxID=516965 RepID=A0ABW0K8I6_9BACL